MSSDVLQVADLTKSFNGQTVLDGLDIEFNADKLNIIMGESGCGKTTLINILAGFIKQDSGEVRGFSNKKISVAFQEDRLLKELTPVKNISVVLERRFPVQVIKEHLISVGLSENDFNKPCDSLSGGMARRVAVVRAFMYESDIIILDEPLKGLDEKNRNMVTDYIHDNKKERPIICVTHDLEAFKEFDTNLIKLKSH